MDSGASLTGRPTGRTGEAERRSRTHTEGDARRLVRQTVLHCGKHVRRTVQQQFRQGHADRPRGRVPAWLGSHHRPVPVARQEQRQLVRHRVQRLHRRGRTRHLPATRGDGRGHRCPVQHCRQARRSDCRHRQRLGSDERDDSERGRQHVRLARHARPDP